MLTHKQVWNAIDTIAERYGFSASGLAKKSGLDPTSFNPSKRNGPDGRPRWPTMESISRLLQASGASMEEFSELLIGRRGQPPKLRQIPLLGLAKAGKGPGESKLGTSRHVEAPQELVRDPSMAPALGMFRWIMTYKRAQEALFTHRGLVAKTMAAARAWVTNYF
jgi:hypothetical protein